MAAMLNQRVSSDERWFWLNYSQVCILLSEPAFVLHDHVVDSPANLRGGFERQGPVRAINVYSVKKLALKD
jgi:hypothetical protein